MERKFSDGKNNDENENDKLNCGFINYESSKATSKLNSKNNLKTDRMKNPPSSAPLKRSSSSNHISSSSSENSTNNEPKLDMNGLDKKFVESILSMRISLDKNELSLQ